MDNNKYLYTIDAIKKCEEHAIASPDDAKNCMHQAAQKVIDAIDTYYPAQQKWAILCGHGHNGGDGYIIAALLQAKKYDVIVMTPHEAPMKSAVAQAAHDAYKKQYPITTTIMADTIIQGQYAVIDALFGIGFKGMLEPMLVEVITALNEAKAKNFFPIIAVDTPSGLHNDGSIKSDILKADYTVSFIGLKAPLFYGDGRHYSGKKIHAPLNGITAHPSNIQLNAPALWQHQFPAISYNAHKYNRGIALIYGNKAMPGAAILAIGGARRIGAGLVKVATKRGAEHLFHAHHPGVIVDSFYDTSTFANDEDDDKTTALLLGPGAGINLGLRDKITQSCRNNTPLILDADALRIIAYDIAYFASHIQDTHNPPILTPHEGEFMDMFGADISQMDKIEGTLQAATISRSVIVRKGNATIIASPNGDVVINNTDSPFLATAGSGDVLAGMITGLRAQKMPSFNAACAAVWIHGDIGKKIGAGLIAEDIITHIGDYTKLFYNIT